MENLQFTIDAKEVNRMLTELNMTRTESRRAMRSALSESGRILRNEARRNLNNVRGKHGRVNIAPLRRFIRMKVYKNASGVLVKMTGTSKRERASLQKKGLEDKAFVLNFFELGTVGRYNSYLRSGQRIGGRNKRMLKKKRYTGSILGNFFFKKAVESKKDEAENSLMTNVEKHIKRVASKRK